MSTKRKSAPVKNRGKSRKTEYEEENISSEHDSELEDGADSAEDGADAEEEVETKDVSSIPELTPPEVFNIHPFYSSLFSFFMIYFFSSFPFTLLSS